MDDCTNCRSDAARAPVVYRTVPTALGAPRLDVAARAYLGVPFLHQGRNPAVGIDCVGLLALAVADCGLTDLLSHDATDYGRDPAHGALEARLCAAFGEPVADLAPGRVVAMAYEGGAARHVGLIGDYYLGGLSLIHTNSLVGKVVERRLSDPFVRRNGGAVITGIYEVAV